MKKAWRFIQNSPLYALTRGPLQIEAEFEIGRRLVSGSLGHVALFCVVLFFTPLKRDHPMLVAVLGSILIAANLMRFVLSKRQKTWYPDHRVAWLLSFDLLLVFSACAWGLLCEESIRSYGSASETTTVLYLIISGISAAAATSLNTNKWRALSFIGLTLGIPASYLLIEFRHETAFAIIFVIYFLFLYHQVRGQSRIYWSLLKSREEISRQKQIIEEALHAKAMFLAYMSHEIRTPMNGILGVTDLLLRSTEETQQTERLMIIKNCGEILLKLVGDILDFSKIEVDKIVVEKAPFPLSKTAEEVLTLMGVRAAEKNLNLSYRQEAGVPAWVKSDVVRFRQILTNLVGNAIKFTSEGRIEVSAKAERLEGKKRRIQISVQDTGIGIPPEAHDKLFRSFSQVDASTTRKFGGTGLGLAICKGLCEKMGGAIWFESQVGQGTTFHFTFVCEETETPPREAGVADLGNSAEMGLRNPLAILVADDNPINQMVAVGLLRELGYHADIAGNGQEVVSKTESRSYDVIFMDCHMPEMDGFEATRKIIERAPSGPRPKIVALSASAMQSDVDRCFAVGMDAFVSKPIEIAKLIRLLNDIKTDRPVVLDTDQGSTRALQGSFDRAAFLANFAGMDDLAVDTIASFLIALPGLLTEIEKAVNDGDPKAIEESAHKFKGAVSNFHAGSVRDLALDLEKMGRNRQLQDAAGILARLRVSTDLLRQDLQHELALSTRRP